MTVTCYKNIEKLFNDMAKKAGVTNTSKYFVTAGADDLATGLSVDAMIVKRLCSSLQNRSTIVNSIKFNDANHNIIRTALFDFDHNKILKAYKNDCDIYNAFIANGIIDNGKGPLTNWKKYSLGIYSGVDYLTNKGGFAAIKNLRAKTTLPSDFFKVSKELKDGIYGLGPALVCDWLKECGCVYLVKPDTHIIDTYKKLYPTLPTDQESIVKEFDNIATSLKTYDPTMAAYKLDRIIWLICSGTFFKDGVEVSGQKTDLLKML